MRLRITHETVYSYDEPVTNSQQSLRLTPSAFDGQKISEWTVGIEDGTPGTPFRDGAGDLIQGWTIRGPVDRIAVIARGELETKDLSGVLSGHREQVSPLFYLSGTPRTKPDAALNALADGVEAEDPLSLAHGLAHAIADNITYEAGVTTPSTTAAEALALGKGVCQDHAHALIALAHRRDMPARYVSGYLHSTADGKPHDSAHAWAEIHIPALGWVGFDPANRCCPDDRYVRLASGVDAGDASPIRGVYLGDSAEKMNVKVVVEEI